MEKISSFFFSFFVKVINLKLPVALWEQAHPKMVSTQKRVKPSEGRRKVRDPITCFESLDPSVLLPTRIFAHRSQ